MLSRRQRQCTFLLCQELSLQGLNSGRNLRLNGASHSDHIRLMLRISLLDKRLSFLTSLPLEVTSNLLKLCPVAEGGLG